MKKLFITLILFPLSLLSMTPPVPGGKSEIDSTWQHVPFSLRYSCKPPAKTTTEAIALKQAIKDADSDKVQALLQTYTASIKPLLENPLDEDELEKEQVEDDGQPRIYKQRRVKIKQHMELYDELFEETNTRPTFYTLKGILEFGYIGLITPQLVAYLALPQDQIKRLKAIAGSKYADPETVQYIINMLDQN